MKEYQFKTVVPKATKAEKKNRISAILLSLMLVIFVFLLHLFNKTDFAINGLTQKQLKIIIWGIYSVFLIGIIVRALIWQSRYDDLFEKGFQEKVEEILGELPEHNQISSTIYEIIALNGESNKLYLIEPKPEYPSRKKGGHVFEIHLSELEHYGVEVLPEELSEALNSSIKDHKYSMGGALIGGIGGFLTGAVLDMLKMELFPEKIKIDINFILEFGDQRKSYSLYWINMPRDQLDSDTKKQLSETYEKAMTFRQLIADSRKDS